MHDDKPPSPRSPFMMSPSARPPSAEEARVVVRVPPPPGAPSGHDYAGTPMYGNAGPNAPFQSGQYPSGYPSAYPPAPPPQGQPGFDQQHFVNAQTMMAGQQPYAMGALPPPEEKKRGISPIPIVAVVLSSLVLGGVILFGNKEPAPAPPPNPAQTAAATQPPAVAPPVVTASTPPAPHVLGASSAPPPALAAFDATAAKAALDALSADLATCKLPKGKTCKLKVAFAADGTVKSATALAPCANSPPAKCLANGVKKATVAPFTGTAPGTITYNYPHGK
jgi:hypothetical protein